MKTQKPDVTEIYFLNLWTSVETVNIMQWREVRGLSVK
jgi:hypothetical protein